MINQSVREAEKTRWRLTTLSLLLAAGIFVLDLQIPLGVAGGVPYVAVVLLSCWLPRRRDTWFAAGSVSVLTIVGSILSPEAGGVMWMVMFNRFLALFVIWVTAFFCLQFKRAEAERERLIAKLEAQNAELERFSYTVSHDLRTPLITVKGFMGLIRDDVARGDTKAVDESLTQMSSAADKMGQLLDELLELSRVGRLTNPSEDVPLKDIAHEAVKLVAGRIAQGDVRVQVANGLPVVFGDRQRLLEVVQNLLDNAVKYMGDQSHPRVEIGSRFHNHETVCYVRDNGTGIDPDYHQKIFGLFNQLDPKADGVGVGLALVKRIVELHGGRVWVESEGPGTGSTFYFTLANGAPVGQGSPTAG